MFHSNYKPLHARVMSAIRAQQRWIHLPPYSKPMAENLTFMAKMKVYEYHIFNDD